MGIIHPEHPWTQYDAGPANWNLERTTALLPLPTNYSSSALEASRVVFTGPCRLEGFTALNTNASTRWIMVFDSAVLPANGAVTAIAILAATNTAVGAYWGSTGRWMQFGLAICTSSTASSKTLGAADAAFDVQYTPLVPYTE